MPVNKNAMSRYKILDELLSNRYHNYSLDDLTAEVNARLNELNVDSVTRRCIEKDIQYLEYEGPFLVEIERYSAEGFNEEKQKTFTKKCLRYAKPSFSIFKKEMSDDEEYLLSSALSLLGQFDGLPNLDALESLRAGLKVSPEKKIISFTRNPLENSNLLGELFTAISNKQVVEIVYHTFANQEDKITLILTPYLLKEYNRRWFLFAATEQHKHLLNLGLDRIDKVTPLPAHEYKDYEGNLDEYFEDIIGVTRLEGKQPETILFWVSNHSKDYVTTKPLHDSQIKYHGEKEAAYRSQYPQLQGGSFFSIECCYNYELIRELGSFGPDLLVLSPVDIQQQVFDRSRQQTQAYQNCLN